MLYLIVGAILVLVVPIVWAIWFGDDGFFSWFMSGVLMWVLTAALGIIFWVVTLSVATADQSYTVNLRALGTDSSIEGRSYFLGGGYVNQKRVLNYIAEQNGGFRLYQADAQDSIIFEDSQDATVTIDYKHTELEWLVPFSSDWDHKYSFHIPEGSVLQDYTIDN